MIDFDNLPAPPSLDEEEKSNINDEIENQAKGTNIVSEFFSENVTYIEVEDVDLDEIYLKLKDDKYMAKLDIGLAGIEEIQKNQKYIKIERSVLINNKIVKFEKGMEKEDSYNKLHKCTFYLFEDFACALGDSKAIKNTMDFLSDIMLTQLTPLIPTEIAMLKLPDRFSTLENITIDRIKHSNIKKMTIYGKANDIADLDVKYPGYDVSSVSGTINTGVDERRIKVTKTGKISFYKVKDRPIYIEHLKFGLGLFYTE